jgi:hypothetical protein
MTNYGTDAIAFLTEEVIKDDPGSSSHWIKYHSDFYCCNREEKTLSDGTITRFKDYPWNSLDNIQIDDLCPWHQQYYIFIPLFIDLTMDLTDINSEL